MRVVSLYLDDYRTLYRGKKDGKEHNYAGGVFINFTSVEAHRGFLMSTSNPK